MRCSNCDYNLIGNQSIFCPNCGAKTNATTMQEAFQYTSQADAPSNTVKIVCIALLAIIIAAGSFFVLRTFGGPRAGAIIEFGGIEWRVLDRQSGKILVISEYVLERRAYHAQRESVTWADSDIRQYLNGEFLNRFTPEERARIVETRIINNANPWFGASGGPDTTDYIFLLSLEELVRYFGNSRRLGNQSHPDNMREGVRDRYNENRNALYMPDGDGWPWWWWLRSPGYSSEHAAFVHILGDIIVAGAGVVATDFGLRPAMWLSP